VKRILCTMTTANSLKFRSIFAPSIVLITILLSVVGASAQEKRPTLDAETAKAIVEGCEHYAASNIAVAIAVAGPGELLAALLRMDDVVPGAVEVAIWKARSSSSLGMSTADLADLAAKTPSISTVPGVASVAGGQPIFSVEGKLLGGVGVSGATENQDTACALAGIDAASRKLDEE
jgi:uncharacterized protein GlcG (DUF336 family)